MFEYSICPSCQRKVELNSQQKEFLKAGQGRKHNIHCPFGHKFSLHNGILMHKENPTHYDLFYSLHGIEKGSFEAGVGEWKKVELSKRFSEIDDVKAVYYPLSENTSLVGVRVNVDFDRFTANNISIFTSGSKAILGSPITVNWIVYGVLRDVSVEVWRENLLFAGRQLLKSDYRPSIIQSAISIESYIYDFVTTSLLSMDWPEIVVSKYINGSSIHSLSIDGVISVCVENLLQVDIEDSLLLSWKRLKKMRDSLAHGALDKYAQVSQIDGHEFTSERERAEFAYRTAVRFIYGIRYQ